MLSVPLILCDHCVSVAFVVQCTNSAGNASASCGATFRNVSETCRADSAKRIASDRYRAKRSPLVSAQLLIKNGGEVDPPELAGLADLTANLLTKGTQTRDATQIAQQIESLGGSLDSGARWDASFANVSVMSTKIPQAMEILADVVRRPTFKSEEVERLRQQYLDNLTLALGDPGSIARFVAARVVFGDSPYGHPISRHDRIAHADHRGRHLEIALAVLPS